MITRMEGMDRKTGDARCGKEDLWYVRKLDVHGT